ncbi:MAG: hypothetical protein JWL76_1471 [Thermoleophilia bacterium]|nr:hypothetical protein [Thermoleophilia bacterium]
MVLSVEGKAVGKGEPMTSDVEKLAPVLADRLSLVSPFRVEAHAGAVGIVWPETGFLGGTDVSDWPSWTTNVHEALITAVMAVLSGVQDQIAHATTEPWPRSKAPYSEPFARIDAFDLELGFTRNGRDALVFEPIHLGLLGVDDHAFNAGWAAVRCVFHDAERGSYEERVTIWQSPSIDKAIKLAEVEAQEYADTLSMNYLGFAQGYLLADSPAQSGAEIFSLYRDSDLEPTAYLNAYFDTGHERQGEYEA